MSNLAIIPARGGSKRIPRKNIKLFLSKPIICYSIESALKSCVFDEVIVSTDDNEIAEIARQAGANVPFIRSNENSDDYATIADVIKEVLDFFKNNGQNFDTFCCILPTAPFVTSQRLSEGIQKMMDDNFDSVFPVVRFGYPIQRALKIEDNKVSMIMPENVMSRTQDLMPTYFDSGQFYWMKSELFYEKKGLFTDNSGAIVLSELEVQDVDTETDWKLAELKYKLIANKGS